MARTVQELTYRLIADEKALVQGLKNASDRTKAFGKQMDRTGKLLSTRVTLPIAAVGVGLIKLAADAEETTSKFNAVFKEQADDVSEWAGVFADSVGRSRTEQLGFLATIQDTLVPLGFLRDEAANMSKATVELATDLASFNNLPTEQVIRDVQSALVGNTETLRKYGVVASQEAIVQEALTSGLIENKNELDAATKAQAIYNLIIEGTTDAQGDAIRTADSATNQFIALKSEATELGIELGQILLPAFTDAVQVVRDGVAAFGNLDDSTKELIITIAAFAAAAGPTAIAIGKVSAALAFLAANPAALTITALAGVSLGVKAIVDARHERDVRLISEEYEGLAEKLELTNEGFAEFVRQTREFGGDVEELVGINKELGTTAEQIESINRNIEAAQLNVYFSDAERVINRVAGDLDLTRLEVVRVALASERVTGELRRQLEQQEKQLAQARLRGEAEERARQIIAEQGVERERQIEAEKNARIQAIEDEQAREQAIIDARTDALQRTRSEIQILNAQAEAGLITQAELQEQVNQAKRREIDALLETGYRMDQNSIGAQRLRDLVGEITSEQEQGAENYRNISEQQIIDIREWAAQRFDIEGDLQERLRDKYIETARETRAALAEERKKQFDDAVQTYNQLAGAVGEIGSQIFQNAKSNIENETAEREQAVQDEIDRQIERAEKTITNEDELAERIKEINEQGAESKTEIQNEAARRSAEIARKEAIFNKATSAVQATIDTAAAVTKALPNIPLSIAIGILGAVQVGAILAQPLPPVPSFAEGGSFTVPPGYSDDSYPLPAAMAQSGERVTVETVEQQALSSGGGGSQMMQIVLTIDGREIAQTVTEYQNGGIVRLELN